MKKLNYFRQATITAILLLVAVFSKAQSFYEKCETTSYKTYKDSTGTYQIKYEYNSCFFSQPATYPPGEPHYQALVTVYKVDSTKKDTTVTILIGKPFAGTYVEKGCFEDVPEYNVNQAKKLQLEAIKQNGH